MGLNVDRSLLVLTRLRDSIEQTPLRNYTVGARGLRALLMIVPVSVLCAANINKIGKILLYLVKERRSLSDKGCGYIEII